VKLALSHHRETEGSHQNTGEDKEHVDVRGDKIRGLRKMQSERLHNFFSSTNNAGMIKSRPIRWVRHVICTLRR